MLILRKGSLVASAVLFSLLAVPTLGESAGSVTGRVTFKGKPPPPKTFQFSKFPNPDFCKRNPNKSEDGKTRLLQEVKVTDDGGLQDAIVTIRGVIDEGWKKQYKGTRVQAELCEWSNFTGVVVNRGQFIVENLDSDPDDPKSRSGVLHNPHAFEVQKASSSTIFNIGLAKKGDTMNKKIILRKVKAGSVMRLQCDQHEFMQAWFVPVKNPHYAKVDEQGKFTLENVPDGKHKLVAWHPTLGLYEQDIEVPAGGEDRVEFEMTVR